jgi:hypothetical protein
VHPHNGFSSERRNNHYVFATTAAVHHATGRRFPAPVYEEPERDLKAWGVVLCLLSSLLMIGSLTAILFQVI